MVTVSHPGRPPQNRRDVARTPSRPWRLVVADMDGTLVTGTTACLHLGDWLGHRAVIEALELRFDQGEISNHEVAAGDAPFYRGVAVGEAVDVMARIPRIFDIEEGVNALRGQAVEATIATVSWSFAARALADLWGFGAVVGADLDVDASGRFTGRVARHIEPEDKVVFAEEHCRRTGIGMDQVVAIGDGRSDLPLFAAAGFSVALNASREVREAASVTVTSTSFLPALEAVPGLLDRHA